MLNDRAIQRLGKVSRAGAGRETGGILIGWYSPDGTTATVTEVTGPPAGSRQGHSFFERSNFGLRTLLRERWLASPRSYYIGEWHLHAANVPEPSEQDIRQMRAVASDQRYECTAPLLVIVSPENKQWRFGVFVVEAQSPPKALNVKNEPEE